jgi:tetratricopeptide (TPR) repeat protein
MAFAEALRAVGVTNDQMLILVGAEATTTAIKSAIGNWLATSVSESDTAIIFFSGHGFFENKFTEAYLLGSDSDARDPYSTALSVSEIQQALVKRVRARHVLLFADGMRRDFFDPENDPVASGNFAHAFAELTSERIGAAVVLANGPGEFSREGQRWNGHGAFTKHLVDVLSGTTTADRADLSGDVMFDRLSALLSEDTNGRQHVWRSGGDSLARITLPRPGRAAIAAATAHQLDSPHTGREGAKVSPSEQPTPKQLPTPSAPSKPDASSTAVPRPSPASPATESRTAPTLNAAPPPKVARAANTATAPNTAPAAVAKNETAPSKPPPSPATSPKLESAPVSSNAKPATPTSQPTTKPIATGPLVAERRPANRRVSPPPASTESIRLPESTAPRVPASNAPSYPAGPTPPRPGSEPPSTRTVEVHSSQRAVVTWTGVPSASGSVASAPSPLILQVEAAISSGNLVEPRGASAWDLYQQLSAEAGDSSEVGRLKPALAGALLKKAKSEVTDDIRSDNISDKLDDLKKAGEMLTRVRTLGFSAEAAPVEKLRAALALIGLQFFDEAEQALTPLQNQQVAGVFNAMGLVYQGKLDSYRAERAFKRAIDLEPKLAAPHYNLGMLYRQSQKDGALAEFEAAASLDPSNLSLVTALGDEYFSRQLWKQAEDAFRKAVKLRPTDDTVHTKLGHALFSQGLTDEANREYERANELRRKQ